MPLVYAAVVAVILGVTAFPGPEQRQEWQYCSQKNKQTKQHGKYNYGQFPQLLISSKSKYDTQNRYKPFVYLPFHLHSPLLKSTRKKIQE